MKSEVLRLIRNAKDGIMPVDICRELNISRAALNQVLRQLEAEGYDIDEVEGKGLMMYSYPEIISSAEIMSRMETKWCGKQVYYRKETGSTNEDAIELAEEGKEHGTVVVTELQTSGRGRLGRSWESPKGECIAMSLILRPNVSPDKASMITLVMALAVADVCAKLTDMDVKIKWPNDVVVNKKKVCGILTQMSSKPGKIDHVVVGVGINVNVNNFPPEIADTATSLLIETGNRHGRADIIVAILDYFEYYYDIFESTEDVSCLVSLYDGYLANKDAEVRVLDPKGEYTGTAQGINDFGELIVQKEDGSFTRVSSGEVSVRGLYGYV